MAHSRRWLIVVASASLLAFMGGVFTQEVRSMGGQYENALAEALVHSKDYVHESQSSIRQILQGDDESATRQGLHALAADLSAAGRLMRIIAELDPLHSESWSTMHSALLMAVHTVQQVEAELTDDRGLTEAGGQQIRRVSRLLQHIDRALPSTVTENARPKVRLDDEMLQQAAEEAWDFEHAQQILSGQGASHSPIWVE